MCFLAFPTFANQARNYGLGGSTSGRVSSVLAEPDNAYSALYNPGLMSVGTQSQFAFSTSVAHVDYSPQLTSLHQTYWTLGYVYPFQWDALARRFALGLAFSGPYNKLRSFQSHAADDFYSLRYGNSDSQLKGTVGLSAEILKEQLFVGAGLSLSLSGAGNAEATLSSTNPTGRMALDVGLNTSLVSGAYFHSGRTNLGLVYTEEVNPEFVQRFDGKASVGGTSTFHQPMTARSYLYYEPRSVELEGQYDLGPVKASLGLAYQLWNGYRAPILNATTVDSSGTPLTTDLPQMNLRNTLNPRASLQIPFAERKWAVSCGYQYRPTPVADLSGTANALDSNTHVFGLSVEHQFRETLFFPFSSRLGLFAQYHRLSQRDVTKANPSRAAGSGYAFSADAYTYGLSLVVGQSSL